MKKHKDAFKKGKRRILERKGFTLIELLVVITIIALIVVASIVIYISTQQKARDTQRLSDIQAIKRAVHLQYADTGEYLPPDELVQLLSTGEYISSLPVDPLSQ